MMPISDIATVYLTMILADKQFLVPLYCNCYLEESITMKVRPVRHPFAWDIMYLTSFLKTFPLFSCLRSGLAHATPETTAETRFVLVFGQKCWKKWYLAEKLKPSV